MSERNFDKHAVKALYEAFAENNRLLLWKMEEFAEKTPAPILESFWHAMKNNSDLMEMLNDAGKEMPQNGIL